MEITKAFIRETEIPIQKGILRLVEYEDELTVDDDETTVEVELNVHPTVASFIDSVVDYGEEQVVLIAKNGDRVTGLFDIHVGKAGVLLLGDPSFVKGVSHIAAIPYEKRSFQLEKGQGIPLNRELQENPQLKFIHFLDRFAKSDLQDHENQQFIFKLKDKLQKGEKLNAFDRYLKREVYNYIMEAFA